ncbi:MAG TPA: hypothetical protein VNA89_12365 [Gemmatimonadaceae bacterium]|nr:hypothetical protein [Gemmatimonadaceae bacterium]
MTDPTRRTPDRIPLGRAITWLAIAAVLVAGLVLYFVYGGATTPLLKP